MGAFLGSFIAEEQICLVIPLSYSALICKERSLMFKEMGNTSCYIEICDIPL